MTTARQSPRCPASGVSIPGVAAETVWDCPTCGRPVSLRQGAANPGGVESSTIPSHGTVQTRMTRHHDDLLRFRQRVQQNIRERSDT